jgi:hypothetical protein
MQHPVAGTGYSTHANRVATAMTVMVVTVVTATATVVMSLPCDCACGNVLGKVARCLTSS